MKTYWFAFNEKLEIIVEKIAENEYKIPFDSSTSKYQTSKMGLAELANVAI